VNVDANVSPNDLIARSTPENGVSPKQLFLARIRQPRGASGQPKDAPLRHGVADAATTYSFPSKGDT
jgi:hypothetical protein